ncbi:efflux RND transporter permease subunit [Pseudoalteromonas sp. MMG005]|uniref:efflux RND transporter permease subunit n=1 Tax=Pseudoalteromonas sp. MMG005 TaxID=2822682 RepID=UPI001B3A6524|nr:efflux RND transporter permease subunit [Pseudoalteromonas sp. MMG005]MBQ4847703.1 efflux RND transporter permease subunit [Pseudoalteromonas sp. MMG005]
MSMSQTKWYLQARLVLGIVAILTITGLVAWHSANEQEDPSFPYRNGMILLVKPGMDITQLTDEGVRPIERVLSEIDEIQTFSARIKQGYANIDLELKEHIYDTDPIWQRIKDRIRQLEPQLNPINISVHDRIQDTQGIVLSISTGNGILHDHRFALKIKDELLSLSDVRTATLIGAPKEQLQIAYSAQSMRETGITPTKIAKHVAQLNTEATPPILQNGSFTTGFNSLTRISTLDKVKGTQIFSPNGSAMVLANIADVAYRIDPISNEQFWINGKRTVGIALTLPPDTIQVTAVGARIKQKIARLNHQYAPFKVHVHLFQPDWTQKRRSSLLTSLLVSCLGVTVVLMCLMSFRSALIVSVSIPAIALSALGIFGMFGGVIHQMTIAGLVLSLGLMVDNSIVTAERIVHHLEQGASRVAAPLMAIRELYKPLATATLTTIAAFIPMLLSKGNVADFIATIPVLVIMCIVLSYLISLSLVPVMSMFFARNSKPYRTTNHPLSTVAKGIALWSLKYPKSTLTMTVVFIVLIMNLPSSHGEFFPKTSRNQAYIDIQLPFGTSVDETTRIAKHIAHKLKGNDKITHTYLFSGNSGPRFYYNLAQQPNESHIARIVFETTPDTLVSSIVEHLNKQFVVQYSDFIVIARELGQGPPISSPIELRVLGGSEYANLAASEAIYSLLSQHLDTQNTRRNYGLGKPQLALSINKQQLQLSQLTEHDLNSYLAWQSSGLTATTLNYTTNPVDLVITVPKPVNNSTELLNTQVMMQDNRFIPLSLLAEQIVTAAPPVITRYNGFYARTLFADVRHNADEEDIIDDLQGQINDLAKQYGVTIKFGGEAQESSQANNALLVAMPAGIVLLFIALILQFNSYRLSLLVMLSIPMGIIGAPAMLSLVNIPFGFMSILGVLALTGIVVNTGIILIESAINGLKAGLSKELAITTAVQQRFRPILLTTTTTIVGMLPLTSSQSPLWPPLAWAVIGGLITSTALMMFVMPLALNLLLENTVSEVETLK